MPALRKGLAIFCRIKLGKKAGPLLRIGVVIGSIIKAFGAFNALAI
jgi:hypothetical protein